MHKTNVATRVMLWVESVLQYEQSPCYDVAKPALECSFYYPIAITANYTKANVAKALL